MNLSDFIPFAVGCAVGYFFYYASHVFKITSEWESILAARKGLRRATIQKAVFLMNSRGPKLIKFTLEYDKEPKP